MILVKAREFVIKRVVAGGGQYADLAHTASKNFPGAVGLSDEFLGTDDHRADGSARPLKSIWKWSRTAVRRLAIPLQLASYRPPALPLRSSSGHRRGEGQARSRASLADCFEFGEVPNSAAATVDGVLDAYQGGAGIVAVRWIDFCLHIVPGESAVVSVQQPNRGTEFRAIPPPS